MWPIDTNEADGTVCITFFLFVQVDNLEELLDVEVCLSGEHQRQETNVTCLESFQT